MEEELKIYIDFFKKELHMMHPFSIRGGYLREGSYMIGITLRIPELIFFKYAGQIEKLFVDWNSCLICKAKMFMMLTILYQNRSVDKHLYFSKQYESLQKEYDDKKRIERNFKEEVFDAMEKWATEAFFLSPEGNIIPVEKNHITKVIDNYDMFNLEYEYIKDIYRKYGETLYTEGYAREEILTKILKNNFVRVRYRPKYDRVTIQINTLTDRTKQNIRSFCEYLINNKIFSRFTQVNIVDLDTAVLAEFSIEEYVNLQ